MRVQYPKLRHIVLKELLMRVNYTKMRNIVNSYFMVVW